MGTQPHSVTKSEIPDHVLYTVGTCVLVIGSIGIIGNLLVLYAFYRYLDFIPFLACLVVCLCHCEDTLHGFLLGLELQAKAVVITYIHLIYIHAHRQCTPV